MHRRYFTTDATMEAIGPMQAISPGLALIMDEILGFVKAMDAYRSGKGGDLQKWLSAWSSSALMIDRRGAPTIWVRDPVIGVFGGIQPDVLSEFVRVDRRRDGFFDRFLWSWPETEISLWNDDEVDPQTIAAGIDLFRRLDAVAQAGGRRKTSLSPAAKGVWKDWYNANRRIARHAGGLKQGVETKLPSQLLRLALILHCLGDPDAASDEVDEATLRGAIALVDYFRAHADRVIAQVERETPGADSLALRVAAHLSAANDWVSMTQLHKEFSNRAPAADLHRALADLEALGQVETKRASTKGAPSHQWRAALRTNEESPAEAADQEASS